MTARATLLACGLLVLAGCSALPAGGGGFGAGTPTEDVTPAPIPRDDDLAPGVTAEGITAPRLVASAHAATIDDASFLLTASRTVRYANGTLRDRLAVRVALAANRTYLASAATAGPAAPVFLGRPPANATYWSNGSVYVRKLTRDGETTYNEFQPPANGAGTWRYWTRTVPFGGRDAFPRSFYRQLFASIPTRLVNRTRADGATTYVLVGDHATDTAFAGAIRDVHDLRLVAEIRDDGLVRALTLQYVGEVDGETVRVARTVRYEHVGETTVGRPSWFQNAVGGGQSTAEAEP